MCCGLDKWWPNQSLKCQAQLRVVLAAIYERLLTRAISRTPRSHTVLLS